MRRPQIYTIRHDFPGQLSTMAKPAGGPQLPDDLTSLRTCGVDVLVSALTEGEQIELTLLNEPDVAKVAGLEFHSVPIGDFGVPDRDTVRPTLELLLAKLHDGHHVVTHCWAGIGRSSLLAASLLVLDGRPPDEAWALISEARGLTVPETDHQRRWVGGFARST